MVIIMLNFNNVNFIKTAVGLNDFIIDNKPNIIMAGRSNVGKSSFINRLCSRKALAKVGGTPGKTRNVNYFSVNDKAYIVDLPGYGYSKVSRTESERFSGLIELYFSVKLQTRIGVLIVDIRHEPTADDRVMCEFFSHSNMPFLVIANKLDKIKKSEQLSCLYAIQTALGLENANHIFPYSSEKADSKDNLKIINSIEEILEQMKVET